MSDPVTPGPLPPPPRRSGPGCLWGCLIAALVAAVVLIATFGYLGHYLFAGFRHDATLNLVMDRVNGDQTARFVLGDSIAVTSLTSTTIIDDLSAGRTASYIANVQGTRSQGVISATVVTQNHARRITALMLTGPDGRRYDLLHGGPQAPPDSI